MKVKILKNEDVKRTLSEAQRMALLHAIRCEDVEEFDGITPSRGQHGMFRLLEVYGYLDYDGQGESSLDKNGNSRSVSIYRITAAGRKAVQP